MKENRSLVKVDLFVPSCATEAFEAPGYLAGGAAGGVTGSIFSTAPGAWSVST